MTNILDARILFIWLFEWGRISMHYPLCDARKHPRFYVPPEQDPILSSFQLKARLRCDYALRSASSGCSGLRAA